MGGLFHLGSYVSKKETAPTPGQWAVKLGPIGVALGEGHWENSAIRKAFLPSRLSAIVIRLAVGAAVIRRHFAEAVVARTAMGTKPPPE
jgi:hypothetical protein